MRTSVEKVRPESNNFACLGKIIKEKLFQRSLAARCGRAGLK